MHVREENPFHFVPFNGSGFMLIVVEPVSRLTL